MEILTKIGITIGLAVISGICGRCGGSEKRGLWYDFILNTNTRDIGCSVIWVIASILWFGWIPEKWYAYALTGVATFGSFRTYWDRLFGYDNLFFSGIVVGVAGLPLLMLDLSLWMPLGARIALLGVSWHALNVYLPKNGFMGIGRDVIEEDLRYTASL